jgi:hypothetical protein
MDEEGECFSSEDYRYPKTKNEMKRLLWRVQWRITVSTKRIQMSGFSTRQLQAGRIPGPNLKSGTEHLQFWAQRLVDKTSIEGDHDYAVSHLYRGLKDIRPRSDGRHILCPSRCLIGMTMPQVSSTYQRQWYQQ